MGLRLNMSLCDSTFGPRIDPACRVFDFTLYFEDLFLAGLPAAAFLLLLPVPLYTLGKSPNVVKRSRLLAFKVVRHTLFRLGPALTKIHDCS